MVRAVAIWLLMTATAMAQGYVDASVNLHGGSGTIIVRGKATAYGLSAEHVCKKVGKTFRFTCSDGKTVGVGTWVAKDKKSDLALFSCLSKDTLAASSVLRVRPAGDVTGCGFPGGKGPERLTLKTEPAEQIIDKDGDRIKVNKRDAFAISKGHFANGNSGGGVFIDGSVVSVMSHGRDDEMAYGASHTDLLAFLDKAQPDAEEPLIQQSRQWGDRDRTGQILSLWEAIKALRPATGSAGPSGPQGSAGPAGPQGPAGPPGATGTEADPVVIQRMQKQLDDQRKLIDKLMAMPVRVQVLDSKTGKVIAEQSYPFGTPIKLILPTKARTR